MMDPYTAAKTVAIAFAALWLVISLGSWLVVRKPSPCRCHVREDS